MNMDKPNLYLKGFSTEDIKKNSTECCVSSALFHKIEVNLWT